MSMERRGRQNLNLTTDTQSALRSGDEGHKGDRFRMESLPNRWVRIGETMQDKLALGKLNNIEWKRYVK